MAPLSLSHVSDHLPDTLSNLVLNDLPRKYDLVSLPPYVYTTLPSTSSFRILELFSGEHNDEIAFRLHVEDWNAPPLYEAISYTWGTDDKICTFCDGHVLYVTPNLRDGLRRMRYIDRSRFLWADAACIDQGSEQHSLEERGHQVSNMRKIYEQASQVLVWLGEDDGEHAPIAIATMREIVSACCTKKNMTPAQLKDCDDIYSIALAARSEDISQDSPESWQSVAWFFSRPWYSRLWVFQEVNAGSEATMLCGACEISWDAVSLCASYIYSVSSIYLNWGFKDSYYQNAYVMRNRSHHKKFNLPRLLNWGRSFNATNPLDRVYALMGMPPFTKMKPWEADYRTSTLELYPQIVERYIHELDNLDILSYVQHVDEVREDFPSWVPQWNQTPSKNATNCSLEFDWKAGGETRVSAEVGTSVLHSVGIVFDTIITESKIHNWDWFDSEHHVMRNHPVLDFWQLQKRDPTSYPTGEVAIDAYAMTLAAGLELDDNKAVDDRKSFLAHFAAYIVRLLEISKQQARYPELEEEARSGIWGRYETPARFASWHRSFFTTKKGYMGLGSNPLQIGDIVCVLFGSSVPYILRPKNGYYQLLGDAYIHGIMEGEAIQQWEAGDGTLEKRIFEIR